MRARCNLVPLATVSVSVALALASGTSSLGCSSSPAGTPFTLTVSHDVQGQSVPLADVAVAVDQGSGPRLERTTGPDGTVTFPDVDLSLGPFAFTAACPGYVAISNLGLTQTGAWHLTLDPLGADPSWADVSGAIVGRVDEGDELFVSTTVPTATYDGDGPEYAIRVAPSTAPITLFVAELAAGPAPASPPQVGIAFQQWAEFTVPPPSGVVSLPLTLPGPPGVPAGTTANGTTATGAGQSLAPVQAQGAFTVPPHMTGASGYVRVTTDASNGSAFLGAQTSVVADPSGALDFTAEYVAPAGVTLETRYTLSAGGAASYVLIDAPPASDAQIIPFLDPPFLPALLPLYGPLPITNATPGLRLSALVETDGEQIVWRVYDGGAAHDAMRLPPLPSTVDPRSVLGTGTVSVSPEVCQLDASGSRCASWAVGPPAEVVVP